MDLRLVQYFVAVAEELHFGRAAERLHIAQPSLSHQIRHLERQLGVTLLERTSRRVELTEAGRTMLSEGLQLLALSERATRLVQAAAAECLSVGFCGSAASTLLPGVLNAFGNQHPNVKVSVKELLLDRIDELLTGGVDVAFIRLVPGQADVELEVVAREPRVVAVPSDHLLAGGARIQFEDLRDESFITNPVVEASPPPKRWLAEQARHGLPGRVAEKAASVQEILTLVAARRGVCLVPASVAELYPRADVSYVEVADADPAVVSLAWQPRSRRPAVDAFIKLVREQAAIRSAATVAPALVD